MAEQDEVMWMHSQRVISIVELARYCGVRETEVRELVEYGALEPASGEPLSFDAQRAPRVRSALRLCHDFELDPASAPLLLSLLDRIHALEEQVTRLCAKGARP